MGTVRDLFSKISTLVRSSGVNRKHCPGFWPSSVFKPAAFHFAIASGTFGTLNPKWLITDPTVPPDGSPFRTRIRTPGNFIPSLGPDLIGGTDTAIQNFFVE